MGVAMGWMMFSAAKAPGKQVKLVDGKYNFGYIDSTAHTGAIAYTPVDSGEDFWTFTSTGYVVGSGSLTRTSIYGNADTGTTLLLLPDSIVEASQGGYTFCYSVNLPSFFFWRVRLYRYHPWDVPQLCFR
ncbi:secreted aspartic proteinase precursor [Metarhizium rileyi]|uniref:Secreted aspartic proteinase n=1 Tax=Metarhizium rileyi (strain RCEF 4871) TaxID=1649241 RepID=A0A167CZM3_METRR|nr:secreted aspartic proteinase precursor [Metarhizium rileyi RCEF 4871]